MPRNLSRVETAPAILRCHPHRLDLFMPLNRKDVGSHLRFHLPVPLAFGPEGGSRQTAYGSVQVSRRRKKRQDPGHLFGFIQAAMIEVVFLRLHIFRIANGERKGTNPRDGFTEPLRMGETPPGREVTHRPQNYPQEKTPLLQREASAG